MPYCYTFSGQPYRAPLRRRLPPQVRVRWYQPPLTAAEIRVRGGRGGLRSGRSLPRLPGGCPGGPARRYQGWLYRAGAESPLPGFQCVACSGPVTPEEHARGTGLMEGRPELLETLTTTHGLTHVSGLPPACLDATGSVVTCPGCLETAGTGKCHPGPPET